MKASEVTKISEELKEFDSVINEVRALRKPIEEVDTIINNDEVLYWAHSI